VEIAPVQVLLAQGRAARDAALVHRALALLDRLRETAERSERTWLHGKTLALQALAYQELGEMAPALGALEQALALAGPAEHRRLFVDEGPPMADLLRRLRTRGTTSNQVAALLAALEGHRQSDGERAVWPEMRAALRPSVPEPLTEREFEVLRLLAAGRSNPEIARALYVELNTIKTHVKNLYGKLGVHGRLQALGRAQELGLL
jgi:LuxR family maltose regulon positive regulatory protein